MSETTNLKLKKHDEPLNENTEQFNVRDYLNGNWDKIEDFAGQVNDKVIEIEDSIDLVKQRTEQAVEDINTDIEGIKEEQTEQNTKIQENANNIADYNEAMLALQAELLATRKDLQAGTLEGQDTGESLYLADSSDARFREFNIEGNSKQETRSGKNKLDLSKVSQKTFNGVTCTYNKEDDSVTFNGTCTTDNSSFIIQGSIDAVKGKTTLTAYYVSGNASIVSESASNLRMYNSGYLKGTTLNLSNIASNKVISTTYAGNDDTLNQWSFKFDEGDVLDNFTVKVMLTDEVDTEYERYGAMPSLEFPSEVEAIGQDVNVFDKDNVNVIENAFINSETMNIDTVAGRRCFYLPCEPNQEYSVLRKKVGQAFALGTTTELPQIGSTIVDINIKNDEFETIKTSSNANYLVVYYKKRATEEVDEDILNNIKIVKGTEINRYSPYNHGSCNVVIENKNELDFSKWNNVVAAHGTIEQVENGIKLTATEDDCYTNTFAYRYQGTLNKERIEKYGIIAKPNNKYTFSCKVNDANVSKRLYMFFADKDYNNIGSISSATSVLTATSPADCKYITVRVGVLHNGNSLTFTDLQVEEGETATDYVAHEEQNFVVPVQQEMLEGDKFDWDNEEEVHNIEKIILNGTETGWKQSSLQVDGYAGFYLENKLSTSGQNQITKCENLKVMLYKDWENLVAEEFIESTNKAVGIRIKEDRLTGNTLNDLKTFLQSNNIVFYYKLATPTKIPFTNEQKAVAKQIREKLHTYKNGTHVYCVDAVSPIFNVRYTRDLNAVINNLSQQAIEGGN